MSKILVEKAKNHSLNLSRITEQALSSIIDYLETPNIEQQDVPKALNFLTYVPIKKRPLGPVVQFGMNAAFAMRRSRVQIPPGPLPFGFKSVIFRCHVNQIMNELHGWDVIGKKRFWP